MSRIGTAKIKIFSHKRSNGQRKSILNHRLAYCFVWLKIMVLRLEGITYVEIISKKSAVTKLCSDVREEVQDQEM
jgi:hypothetical protein